MQSHKSIEVRQYGNSGPLVVLLHGGPGAPGEMATVARYLSGRFRTLEPLQRASGRTRLTVAQHITDLHNVLKQTRRTETIRLVGFSWGAMLALTYAARHYENIDCVILIGCGTFDEHSRKVYRDNMDINTTNDDRKRIEKIEVRLRKENDKYKRNELFGELGSIYCCIQSYKLYGHCDNDILHFDEEGFRQTWADAISLQQQGIQPAEFANIRAPVTMIHGDDDPHPGKMIYKSLAPFIRNLQYIGLPRCGHKPWTERYAKDDFYKLLTNKLI